MTINLLRLMRRIVAEGLGGTSDVEVWKAQGILTQIADTLNEHAPANPRNLRGFDLNKVVSITKGAVGVADDLLDERAEEQRHDTVNDRLKAIQTQIAGLGVKVDAMHETVIEARDCCCAQRQPVIDGVEPFHAEIPEQEGPAPQSTPEHSDPISQQPTQGGTAPQSAPAGTPGKPGKPDTPEKPEKPEKPKKDGPIKGQGMGKGKGAGKHPDKGHMGERHKGHQKKG